MTGFTLRDVTLRDGLQDETPVPTAVKVELFEEIVRARSNRSLDPVTRETVELSKLSTIATPVPLDSPMLPKTMVWTVAAVPRSLGMAWARR